jgi:hypothetical protein
MKKFILGFALMLAGMDAGAQNPRNWLSATLAAADTVWLIRHGDLPRAPRDSLSDGPRRTGNLRDGVQPVTAAYVDSIRRAASEDLLLRDGRLDPRVLQQQKMLDGSMRDTLIQILSAVIEYDRVEDALCFDPHQAIVWSKNGKISYIDCCFHCLRYAASSDLTPLQGRNFGYRKWAMLQGFFERQGMLKSNREGYGEK